MILEDKVAFNLIVELMEIRDEPHMIEHTNWNTMLRINRENVWNILTRRKHKLLISAKISIKKAKEVLQVVNEEVEETYRLLPYSEILHFNEDLIVWEKGYTLEKENITYAYIENELLFISGGKHLMVFLVE